MAQCEEKPYTSLLATNYKELERISMKFFTLTALFCCMFAPSLSLGEEGLYLFRSPASKSKPQMDLMSSMDIHLKRDLVLGNIIKSGLENLHFNKKVVDDGHSAIAFQEYLEYLDFGKRFLTLQDIGVLKKYEKEIDNQIISGRLELMRQGETCCARGSMRCGPMWRSGSKNLLT